MLIRIGTRKSKLALIQTESVIEQIIKYFPKADCQIVPIITTGDLITDKNLYDIGGKALFLKEIEQQLIDGNVDLAVHSLKDVPGKLPEGLVISAALEREDARDVLVSHKFKSIETLPNKATIGTSSIRRKIFLQKNRPDLNIVAFRGNVNSRIEKLNRPLSKLDGAVLALAGLKRLRLFDEKYCHIIDESYMLPAAGQGVIAIEIRNDNARMHDICQQINHKKTWNLIQAERSFLEYLDASCRTPLAAHATYFADKIKAEYMMADFEGTYMLLHTEIGEIGEGESMGIKAAKKLLAALQL